MAETVYLSDGTTEVILVEKPVFLERLIREKLGDEAARCFSSFAAELAEDLEIANKAREEHEQAADGYLQMCRDALDQFDLIKQALQEPRLDRKKITDLVNEGYNNLYKNL